MHRSTTYFSGHVQGVGFRYTALRVARGYPGITGTVRNLADGRVELIAEGEAPQIAEFVADVRAQMGDYIRHADTQPGRATGEFRGFSVTH